MRSPRPMLSIFLTVVIDLLGFGIVLPLLPLYADEWHAAPAVIALLFAALFGAELKQRRDEPTAGGASNA